jgi:hypothetical protein
VTTTAQASRSESVLFVLSTASDRGNCAHLSAMASAMGLSCEVLTVSAIGTLSEALLHLPSLRCTVAVSSRLLTSLDRGLGLASVLAELPDAVENCLVFGFAECVAGGLDVADATGSGGVCVSLKPGHYQFAHAPRVLGPFRGLSFSVEGGPRALAFASAWCAGSETLLETAAHPVFVLHQQAQRSCYFWAIDSLTDVDHQMVQGDGTTLRYAGLLPALIFLRQSFGRHCWHAAESAARLIVDDPLVRPRYGHLRYSELAGAMRRSKFGTTIAFIPWNRRRTNASTAKSMLQQGQQFSLCVHGSDHMNHEFGLVDEDEACRKSMLAMRRMREHKLSYGLGFDPVMVFPQGQFSVPALRGLQRGGLLAAVNSTCTPYADDATAFSIAELMAPAVTRFHGFPVFLRRYPSQQIDFAFDLLVGRPVLIAEHHQYFKGGCEQLEQFVASLQAMDPQMQWPTLEDLVQRACWQRQREGALELVFYTRSFCWRNAHSGAQRVKFRKYEPSAKPVRVAVDHRQVTFSFEAGWIEFECEVAGLHDVQVHTEFNEPALPKLRASSVAYRSAVWSRRVLSEFRDNVLSRAPKLLKLAQWAVGMLKASA